jgi:outer membrane protein TolC
MQKSDRGDSTGRVVGHPPGIQSNPSVSPNFGFCISRIVKPSVCRNLVILGSLTALPAAAQEPLTLERAVQAALDANATLRAARAGVDEATAHSAEARSDFFPRVSLTESWQRGNQPVFVFSSLLSARQFGASNFAIDALNHPDPIGFFRTGIGVEQLIFDGGRQRSTARIATLRFTIAEASTNEAAAGLAVTTTQAFGRVLKSDAARRAAEAGTAAAREDLTRAERRRDAGLVTDADVLALVVHVADLQQRAIHADGEASVARAELNRLMGTPIDAAIRVVVPASVALEDLGASANVTLLLAEAEAGRPELKRAAASEQIASAARQQARSALVPQVAAQAAVDVAGTRFADRASSWIVGSELRWTFSTGGAELAAMKATAASIARARAEADDARTAVHVDVITALRRVEAARARYAVGRTSVDQARESQRIIRDRFEAGIAPINDVLRASTAMLDTEANSVSALVDTIVARAMLHRALGRTP